MIFFSFQDDTASVISFTSSVHSLNDAAMVSHNQRLRREDIGSKIECVNSLVSLLGCKDIDKMSRTFEAMSSSKANCELLRSHRVIPLLVELLHTGQVGQQHQQLQQHVGHRRGEHRPSREIRQRVARALHNIVHAHPTDKQCKREAKVLKLLETLRLYSDYLRDLKMSAITSAADADDAKEEQEEEDDTEEEKKKKEVLKQHGCRPVCLQLSENMEVLICGKPKYPGYLYIWNSLSVCI